VWPRQALGFGWLGSNSDGDQLVAALGRVIPRRFPLAHASTSTGVGGDSGGRCSLVIGLWSVYGHLGHGVDTARSDFSERARRPNSGSGGCGRAGSLPASRVGRAPVGAARCRAAPPDSRRHGTSHQARPLDRSTRCGRVQLLADHFQTEVIWPAERRQVSRAEGSVTHEPRAQPRSSGISGSFGGVRPIRRGRGE
jgi:hypothetical protein